MISNHFQGKGCKYCSVGNSSKKEQAWLDYLGLPNDNIHRNVSIIVDDKRYVVDGYIPNSNIVYEFLGDFWHGNPSVFDLNKMNTKNHKTFGVFFDKTVEKIRALRKAGYKVVSIWEKRYDKDIGNRRITVKSK